MRNIEKLYRLDLVSQCSCSREGAIMYSLVICKSAK